MSEIIAKIDIFWGFFEARNQTQPVGTRHHKYIGIDEKFNRAVSLQKPSW